MLASGFADRVGGLVRHLHAADPCHLERSRPSSRARRMPRTVPDGALRRAECPRCRTGAFSCPPRDARAKPGAATRAAGPNRPSAPPDGRGSTFVADLAEEVAAGAPAALCPDALRRTAVDHATTPRPCPTLGDEQLQRSAVAQKTWQTPAPDRREHVDRRAAQHEVEDVARADGERVLRPSTSSGSLPRCAHVEAGPEASQNASPNLARAPW